MGMTRTNRDRYGAPAHFPDRPPTKIYRTWVERLESGVLSQSMCRQFAASISRYADGYDQRGFKSNLTVKEACRLRRQMTMQGGVRLTPQDEQKGLDWLRRHGMKGMGLPAEVLTLFSHFTYNGDVHVDGRRSLPVWQVHLTDGRVVEYYWGAWQEMAYGRPDARQFGWEWVTGGFFPSETGHTLTSHG